MSTTLPAPSRTPPLRDRVGADEYRLRTDLAAAYRLVALFGWDDLIFTHLSARVPGPEHHFLINPYGLLFEEITASSLVKIDLDGTPVDPSPYAVNPAGFTIHSAVHAAREDAACVMHVHTVAGVAVSCQEQGLLPLNQMSMLLGGRVAYHDYEGVALSLDERPRLVADLGTSDAMLLRNHGTLTVGRDVASAFLTMYFLEKSCATQVAATSGGARLHLPAEAVQALVQRQAATAGSIADELLWPALLRKLDRTDPGYRD